MHITIYPNEVSLIEDVGVVSILNGKGEIVLEDVSPLIDFSTFRCLPRGDGLKMTRYSISKKEDKISVHIFFEASSDEDWEYKFSYHITGVSWDASYTIFTRNEVMDIVAYAGIVNKSGIDFLDAEVHLITKYDDGMFFNYDISPKTFLSNGSVNYIELFSVVDVGISKKFVAPYESDVAMISRSFRNDEESGLGMEMPPGDVKVYEEIGDDGHLAFVDSIKFPSVPIGSIIELSSQPCDGIDIDGEWDRFGTATIRVINNYDMGVVLGIEERCPNDEMIFSNTCEFIRWTEEMVMFLVEVPAMGETIIKYTIDPSLMGEEWGRKVGWNNSLESVEDDER